MRYLGLALGLIMGLAACNMTTATQPENQLSNQAIALATHTPIVVQAAPTQIPAPTQTQPPANNNLPQSVVAAVLPACTPRTDWQIYTVAAGDTLGQIAQRSGTDSGTLATANCLKDANTISVGQALRVPSMPSAPVISNPSTANLRMVGNFAGRPDLEACWASNAGTNPIVYALVDGQAIAYLSNRVPVVSATSTWVQVHLNGTTTIPESTGWMRISDVSLIGFCTEATGIPLNSFRGLVFGNTGHSPEGLCMIMVSDPTKSIVYDQPPPSGSAVGMMTGWAKWISTQGDFYQFEQTANWNDQGMVTVQMWISTSAAHLVNC